MKNNKHQRIALVSCFFILLGYQSTSACFASPTNEEVPLNPESFLKSWLHVDGPPKVRRLNNKITLTWEFPKLMIEAERITDSSEPQAIVESMADFLRTMWGEEFSYDIDETAFDGNSVAVLQAKLNNYKYTMMCVMSIKRDVRISVLVVGNQQAVISREANFRDMCKELARNQSLSSRWFDSS